MSQKEKKKQKRWTKTNEESIKENKQEITEIHDKMEGKIEFPNQNSLVFALTETKVMFKKKIKKRDGGMQLEI